ncbi:hypothetical protein T4A_11306 [Trichinella pseudospiralis]|uniref:Uncharacterized protein n=1 Tax=Trichinella pseudospiralis TaxID=6337 RepID=A0A0V1FS82_TRIPS|nr:hypothetical protein T4A_11306 [Trichinella pseudospiralis]KRY88891.1 hypothetical protein T4D_201 [Trichinella pseudospiralis]
MSPVHLEKAGHSRDTVQSRLRSECYNTANISKLQSQSVKPCSIKFDYFANLNQSNESLAPQFLRRSRFVQVSIKKVPTVNKDGGAHKPAVKLASTSSTFLTFCGHSFSKPSTNAEAMLETNG